MHASRFAVGVGVGAGATGASMWENVKPWGALLKFVRPCDEAAFRDELSKSTLQRDLHSFSGMLCLGAAYSFTMTICHGPTVGIGIFSACMLLTAVRIGLVTFRKAWFLKNRTAFVAVVHQGHSILSTIASRFVPMPRLGSAAFLPIVLVTRTPVAILFFFGPSLAIPFRFHLFSQLVACSISSMWVPWFCDRCTNPSNAYPIETTTDLFSNLNHGITQWLHRLTIVGPFLSLKEPHPGQDLCWVPMMFMHWMLSFIAPCLVAYTVEVFQRWVFIAAPNRRSPFAGNAEGDFVGSVFLGLWVAFMMVQSVWIVFRDIGGGLQDYHLDPLCQL